MTGQSNKRMKLTSVERIGRSQLILGVRRTTVGPAQRSRRRTTKRCCLGMMASLKRSPVVLRRPLLTYGSTTGESHMVAGSTGGLGGTGPHPRFRSPEGRAYSVRLWPIRATAGCPFPADESQAHSWRNDGVSNGAGDRPTGLAVEQGVAADER